MDNKLDSFCAVPWVQLSTKPNGDFRVCCLMNTAQWTKQGLLTGEDGKPLNAVNGRFDQAINSAEARDIRRRMLKGERPIECETCWQKESLGLGSKRTVTNKSYANEFTIREARQRTTDDGTTDVQPSYFDLRFGNLCNLRCVMCHPGSSSQWYEDYRRLWNTDHFYDSGRKVAIDGPTTGYNWHESQIFWTDLESRVDHIRQIYLVGGEPMLIESHFDFLELCVQRGVAHKIILEYDTNLTRVSDKALLLWKQFKKIILRVSIDDFGAQNEYIRFPSKWKNIEANLKLVHASELPLELSVSTTWQILNAFTVTRLWEELGFVTSTRVLNTPAYMDVAHLPQSAKEAAIANLENFSARKSVRNWEKISAYIAYLQKPASSSQSEMLDQFKDYIMRIDRLRGTDYAQTFPELATHLNA